jgi:hypothetical protein
MNYQTSIIAVALIALRFALPFASAESKAYEFVDYKGKGAGVTVVFKLAHGYPTYSEIRITKSTSHKTMEFYLPGGR